MNVEHEHVFHRAQLRHRDGTPIEGGRRCSCGLEIVGDGPFALNADLVRSGHDLIEEVTKAFQSLADRLAEANRRRFP